MTRFFEFFEDFSEFLAKCARIFLVIRPLRTPTTYGYSSWNFNVSFRVGLSIIDALSI